MNNTPKAAVRPRLTPFLRRPLATLALACAAVALGGCAALAPSTPEQIVQQRATDYWKARLAGQPQKAYALSTPAYRKLRTEKQFQQQFGAGASVERAEVVKVSCEAEKCTTRVKLGARPALAGLSVGVLDTYFDEIWVLEDGQWWHYQDL